MVFAVLPSYLIDELGVTHTSLGLIEGLAISLSFVTKVLAGVASDYFRVRKPFILLGSLLSTSSKPFFALSQSFSFVFGAAGVILHHQSSIQCSSSAHRRGRGRDGVVALDF